MLHKESTGSDECIKAHVVVRFFCNSTMSRREPDRGIKKEQKKTWSTL